MRTAQEISDFLLSLDVDKSKYEGGSIFTALVKILLLRKTKIPWTNLTAILNAHCNDGDLERMLKFGMLAGHGYSFTYNGDAVVLTGEALYFESPLAELFKEQHGSEILAQGDILAFDTDNNGNFNAYKHTERETPRLNPRTWNRAIDNYSTYLANNSGYPLRFILDVVKSDELTEEGGKIVEHPSLDTFLSGRHLSLPHRESNAGSSLRTTFPELGNVTLLQYLINPNIYRDSQYLAKVFDNVKFQLDMWSFLRSAE